MGLTLFSCLLSMTIWAQSLANPIGWGKNKNYQTWSSLHDSLGIKLDNLRLNYLRSIAQAFSNPTPITTIVRARTNLLVSILLAKSYGAG